MSAEPAVQPGQAGSRKPDSLFRYGIVCALEPLPDSKPAILRGDMEAMAETARIIGYDAIELHIRNPLNYKAHALRKAADDQGLSFCAISTGLELLSNGLSLISDDPSVRSAAVRRLREHIDLAAVLDCLVVIGSMRANIDDPRQRPRYEGYLTEALLSLAEYARTRGVGLVFESIMRYINNYLNTVPETSDYLRRLNQPNLNLHIDTHSMIVEDPDLPAAIRYCRQNLGYVHFSDSNRRYPGGGNIDFKSIMKTLKEIGYRGTVACECVPWPDPVRCAQMSLDYIRALETCIAIESAE